MPRYRIKIAYHGKDYFGFQVQKRKKTIQREIEKALKKLLGEAIRIIPSGRTDTGVHALEQVIHFESKTVKSQNRLDQLDIKYKLNAVLPENISVSEFKKVPSQFHARNHAQKKSYIYQLLISPAPNPFIEDYVWRLTKPLNQKAMEKAASYILGEHDFSSFCASDSTAHNKIKKIESIQITNKKPAAFLALKNEQYINIEFIGNGFLKQMVRNITGTLVKIGQDKIPPEAIKTILAAKDRKKAFQTAPAQGLFLKKVWY